MRTVVIAFVLGTLAVGVVASIGGLALGIAAQAGGWSSFRAGIGPLVLVSYERTAAASATSFGAGLPLLALAGGVLNAIGAGVLSRRGG